jgi:AmiR/NasT family two-component response regulator
MGRPTATPRDAPLEADAGLESSRNAVFAAATKASDHERHEERETIVVVGGRDSELVERATALGITPRLASADTLEAAITLALKQAQELARLRALTARVAPVERAKGILMERHKISEREAHEQLRNHARKLNMRLTAVAEAIESSYVLVPLEET